MLRLEPHRDARRAAATDAASGRTRRDSRRSAAAARRAAAPPDWRAGTVAERPRRHQHHARQHRRRLAPPVRPARSGVAPSGSTCRRRHRATTGCRPAWPAARPSAGSSPCASIRAGSQSPKRWSGWLAAGCREVEGPRGRPASSSSDAPGRNRPAAEIRQRPSRKGARSRPRTEIAIPGHGPPRAGQIDRDRSPSRSCGSGLGEFAVAPARDGGAADIIVDDPADGPVDASGSASAAGGSAHTGLSASTACTAAMRKNGRSVPPGG